MAHEQRVEQREGAMPEANRVNGIDTNELFAFIEGVKADPSKASCAFSATTRWKHGTVSECVISKYMLGGEEIPQRYTIPVDEPSQILGTDSAPNPQMVLFAAVNACVLTSFIVNAAAQGIHVDSAEIDIEGELDVRGFLGLDPDMNPGYDEISMVCRVRADATRERLEEILETSTRLSPNFQNMARPVNMKYRLDVQ